MSDQPGSMRFGDVVVPAVFHGTARLVRPGETPAPPRPLRHDNVEGEFHGEFDLSFELLVGIGYVPVDPSHPAYPLYLAASTAPPSPPPAPVHVLDPNHPDTVILPLDTVVNIPAERALGFGLVPPGWATGEAEPVAAPQPVRRRNVPPPVWTGPGSSADRHTPPPPIGDYEAFLRFLGDPDKHPLPEPSDDAGANPRDGIERNSKATLSSHDASLTGSGHLDTAPARAGDATASKLLRGASATGRFAAPAATAAATSIENTAIGAWTLAGKGDDHLRPCAAQRRARPAGGADQRRPARCAHHGVAVVSAAANDPAGTAATLRHGGAPNATCRSPNSGHATGRPVEPRRPASPWAGAPVRPEVAQRQDAIP